MDKVIQLWIEVCQLYFKNLILRQLSVKFKHRCWYCFSVLIYYFPKLQESGPKVINPKLNFWENSSIPFTSLLQAFSQLRAARNSGFNSVTNGERKNGEAHTPPSPYFSLAVFRAAPQLTERLEQANLSHVIGVKKYWLPEGVRQTSNSQ